MCCYTAKNIPVCFAPCPWAALYMINPSWTKAQIEAELDRHWERLHQGLSYYKPPRYDFDRFDVNIQNYTHLKTTQIITGISLYYSSSSAGKVKGNKDVAQPLKDFGLRISKLLVRMKFAGLCYAYIWFCELLFPILMVCILWYDLWLCKTCFRVLMNSRVWTFCSVICRRITEGPVTHWRCVRTCPFGMI